MKPKLRLVPPLKDNQLTFLEIWKQDRLFKVSLIIITSYTFFWILVILGVL